MDVDQQPDDDAEYEDTDPPRSAPAEEEPGESVDVAPADDEGMRIALQGCVYMISG